MEEEEEEMEDRVQQDDHDGEICTAAAPRGGRPSLAMFSETVCRGRWLMLLILCK